jgi:hypothetical protein
MFILVYEVHQPYSPPLIPSFTFPLPLVPSLSMTCFSFLSVSSLGVCLLFSGGFALMLYLLHALYLSQCNPLHCTFSPFSSILCLTLCCMLPFALFLYRCDVHHNYSLSFFPSFPSPLVYSTSLTFGYMFCINFYLHIILLVFALGLYST